MNLEITDIITMFNIPQEQRISFNFFKSLFFFFESFRSVLKFSLFVFPKFYTFLIKFIPKYLTFLTTVNGIFSTIMSSNCCSCT